MSGDMLAIPADRINYKAWANNMIAFIRERDMEASFTDWCGGWPYPGKPEPYGDLLACMIDMFENPEFQVAIGGNPIKVDALMERSRAAIAKAGGVSA